MNDMKKGWKNNIVHNNDQFQNIDNTNLIKIVIQLYWEDKKEKAK